MNLHRLLPQRIAFWTMVPLVGAQGLWVRRHAPRFADARGPNSGSVGSGPTTRLLAIGDSIVAGVGVETLEDALIGRFAAALAERGCTRVEWRAVGKTGARAALVRADLVGQLPPAAFDIIVVSVGVNDVTGLVRSQTWSRDAGDLVDALRRHSPAAVILLAGLPPLGGFPLLPQPLRYVFGVRARTFDRILQQVAATRERCFHVPNEFEPSPQKFSADGYHPSADSYRVWGEALADWAIRNGARPSGDEDVEPDG